MARFVLEDGTVFSGESIGASGEVVGPVIFDTRVVGYQEVMTDPANAGKILTLTYPLIGNYGINPDFNESDRAWIKGLIIKEKSNLYSNWQATASLDEFLKKEKIVALTEVDTRTLAVKIREDGEMLGIISPDEVGTEKLLQKIKDFKARGKISFLPQISVKKDSPSPYPSPLRGKDKGEGEHYPGGKKPRIVVIDLGVLKGFLKQLSTLGCEIILVPYSTKAKELLKLNPDGIIISNGPEEDPALKGVISTVKELLGNVPLLGISTGHEVIIRALGGEIIKMKLGHHGVNYPVHPVRSPQIKDSPCARKRGVSGEIETSNGVKTPDSLKGEITVQNHSWVVDENSLSKRDGIKIAERNLNDNSIEKIISPQLKFISVQYYPTSPGLGEVHPVFKEFVEMISG